ncbi:Halomucin [Frankliniella fusca]|uniref:Halomucin n=1 Tax=Frankliniella fusca TaxID=407009 RepID=A0AAE1HYH2_9NEOP|nr:Halomucin [Frankliniella fusca]
MFEEKEKPYCPIQKSTQKGLVTEIDALQNDTIFCVSVGNETLNMTSSSSDSDENSHTPYSKRGIKFGSKQARWKKRNVQCSQSLNGTSENHDVTGASHLHPNMAFDLGDYFQDECSNLQDGKIEANGANRSDASVESDSIANEACNSSDRTSQTSGNSDTNDTSQESDEDESSDSDDNSYEDCNLSFLPEPLFSGSKNSVGEAIRLLLDLYFSHALSKQCLKDLVTLLHRLLPIGNNFPRSYYFFKKTIDPFIPPKLLTVHTACDKCGTYVGQKKKGGEKVQCPACTLSDP